MNDTLVVNITVGELKQLIAESVQEALANNTPAESGPEVFLKRKEVARLFRISLVTLHDWMNKGLIPFHRIRSRVYFKNSEIREVMSKPIYIGRYGRRKM